VRHQRYTPIDNPIYIFLDLDLDVTKDYFIYGIYVCNVVTIYFENSAAQG
jgi:hypothetical protein